MGLVAYVRAACVHVACAHLLSLRSLTAPTLVRQAAVEATWTNPNGSGLAIVLDNTAAQAAAEAADRDPAARSATASNCLFAQAFRALGGAPAAALRSRMSDRGVLFQVCARPVRRSFVPLADAHVSIPLRCPSPLTANSRPCRHLLP